MGRNIEALLKETDKGEVFGFLVKQVERRMKQSNYKLRNRADRLREWNISLQSAWIISGADNINKNMFQKAVERGLGFSRDLFGHFYRDYGHYYLPEITEEKAFWNLTFYETFTYEWFALINRILDSLQSAEVEGDHNGAENEEIVVTITPEIMVRYVAELGPRAEGIVLMLKKLFAGKTLRTESGLGLKFPREMLNRDKRGRVVYNITDQDEAFTTYARVRGETETIVEVPTLTPWGMSGLLNEDGDKAFWGFVHEDQHVEQGMKQMNTFPIVSVNEISALAHELALMEILGEYGEARDISTELIGYLLTQAMGEPSFDHNSHTMMVNLAEKIVLLPRELKRSVIESITGV